MRKNLSVSLNNDPTVAYKKQSTQPNYELVLKEILNSNEEVPVQSGQTSLKHPKKEAPKSKSLAKRGSMAVTNARENRDTLLPLNKIISFQDHSAQPDGKEVIVEQ